MSLEEVKRFDERLKKDNAFSNSAKEFLGETFDGIRTHKIAEFARINGFNFSAEDLLKFFSGDFISDGNKSSVISESPLKNLSNSLLPKNDRLQNFFIWLSGASPEILATCPESETKSQAALGATVLIPTLFAVIASSFALYSINISIQFIIPISLIWAFIILTMDRALLASYRSGLSFFNKLTQFVLRFFIAVLIGLSVSHPLILTLFSESIQNKFTEHKEQTLKSLQSNYDEKNASLNKEIELQREKLTDIRNTPIAQCKINTTETSPIIQQYQDKIKKLTEEKDSLSKKADSLSKDINELEKKAFDEKMGKKGDDLSGKRGEGPEYNRIRDSIAQKNREKNQIINRINLLDSKISEEEKSWNDAIRKEDDSQRESREENKKQCQDFIKRQTEEIDRQSAQVDTVIAQLVEQKTKNLKILESEQAKIRDKEKFDILSQTLFLHKIFNGEGGYIALITFIVFGLLFMIIDTIPIILKFSSSGRIYDLKSSTNEFKAKLNDNLYRKGYEELAPKINDHRLAVNYEKEKTEIDFSQIQTIYKQLDDYLKMREQFISEFLQKERHERENNNRIHSEFIRIRHEKNLNMLINHVYEDDQTQMKKFFVNRQDKTKI